VFSSTYIFGSFVKNQIALAMWVYFWVFYFVPLGLCVCFCGSTMLFLLLGSVAKFEVQYYNISNIALFLLKIALVIQTYYTSKKKKTLRIDISISVKNDIRNFMGIALSL
jgi:hypothetical protein